MLSTFSNIFSSETAGPTEARFYVEPDLLGMGERKFIQMVLATLPRWPTCQYMVKPYKILFSGTKGPMTLKLDMQQQVHEYYKVCSNNDPGLTLTYFAARSNLLLYAFLWEKVTNGFFRKCCSI